jgi:hypothetical protein
MYSPLRRPNDNNNTENIVKIFLDIACPMTLPIKPFSPKEVKEEINKCNNHKAPGFDLITGQILKKLPKKSGSTIDNNL